MGISNVLQTGHSGLMAAKAAIATAGHNIANANSDGYSRQRVLTTPISNPNQWNHQHIGAGTQVQRVERLNDEYIEKQVRNAKKDFAHYEEKELILRQTEDIFNEMNGHGLNELISKFFNDFRRLSNEPESLAIRQVVRESSRALVHEFHRIRHEVDEVRTHIDARLEGYTKEMNADIRDLLDLNQKIKTLTAIHQQPNDLLDRRDLLLRKLSAFMDLTIQSSDRQNLNVGLKNCGSLILDDDVQWLISDRTPADTEGKLEGSIDIKMVKNTELPITHRIQGGKFGALIEIRDQLISQLLGRLDEMAYQLMKNVNAVHTQGVTLTGETGVPFFKHLDHPHHAAETLSLSAEIESDIKQISTGMAHQAPGDNRIALAISQIQNERCMNDGFSTLNEWYHTLVSDVGVVSARNRMALHQQQDSVTQLNKMREQISGVSIDEETTHLLQYQHVFDASAKVIQIADELLKTILALKRD